MSTSTTTNRRARRRGRLRNTIARRLEILEDRTLLNASIDIDAAGLLTYKTDGAIAETLNISVAGNVYTFASDVDIDVLTNIPDLVVTGDGTTTVTVAAISGLAVAVNFDFDEINVLSSNVEIAIQSNSTFAVVRLGDGFNPAGLGALTAPIVMASLGASMSFILTLNDAGSSSGASYTLTPTTLTADNGFGGLTYSGARNLSMWGSVGVSEYVVQGTADGVTTTLQGLPSLVNRFVVERTSLNAHSGLELMGGAGSNTFEIKAASSPIWVSSASGTSSINLGKAGSTADLSSSITVANVSGEVEVTIDDSAGTIPGAWNLAMRSPGSRYAKLTGFSSDGALFYTPREVDLVTLNAPVGRANSLTVDFEGTYLLSAGSIKFNAGGDPERGSASGLVLLGVPAGGAFVTETHTALDPHAGEIVLKNGGGLLSRIQYDGLGAESVYSTVSVTNYYFNHSDPAVPVIIREGANSALTGNLQTLLISAPGSFVGAHVAHKSDITVYGVDPSGGYDVTVDYRNETRPWSVSSITVLTQGGDDVTRFVNLPPRVSAHARQGDGDDRAFLSIPGIGLSPVAPFKGGDGHNVLTLDAGGLPIAPENFSPSWSGATVVSGAPMPTYVSYQYYEHVFVTNLPPALPTVTGATINAVQGQRLVDAVAGAFTITAPGAMASDFTATIAWGDGSTSAGAIVQDAANPSVFYVTGTHTYRANAAGLTTTITVSSGATSYTQVINDLPVTFVSPEGGTVSAEGTAVVFPATPTAADPQPTIAAAAEGTPFVDQILGAFADANPLATVGEFTAMIDWGDGSPLSPGKVIQPGGLGAPFLVVGSHAYASARPATDPPTGQTPAPGPVTADGIYPIRIFIQSVHGSTAELSNTITVLDREMVVTGQLDPASDSGVSNSDAVTNVRRPDFFGAAGEPGAMVFLYATPFGGTAVLIGQATADANGAWSITSNVALADGGYVIQAQAYDASGNSISALTTISRRI